MIEASFPVWREGERIGIDQLLDLIPANNWMWVLLEFSGVVLPPLGTSFEELERYAVKCPAGHCMTWHELLHFAENVEGTWWMVLVATDEDRARELEAIAPSLRHEPDAQERAVSECHLVLRVVDSREWRVGAPTSVREPIIAVRSMQRKFGAEAPAPPAVDVRRRPLQVPEALWREIPWVLTE